MSATQQSVAGKVSTDRSADRREDAEDGVRQSKEEPVNLDESLLRQQQQQQQIQQQQQQAALKAQFLKEYNTHAKKQLALDPLMALYEEVVFLRERCAAYEEAFRKVEGVIGAAAAAATNVSSTPSSTLLSGGNTSGGNALPPPPLPPAYTCSKCRRVEFVPCDEAEATVDACSTSFVVKSGVGSAADEKLDGKEVVDAERGRCGQLPMMTDGGPCSSSPSPAAIFPSSVDDGAKALPATAAATTTDATSSSPQTTDNDGGGDGGGREINSLQNANEKRVGMARPETDGGRKLSSASASATNNYGGSSVTAVKDTNESLVAPSNTSPPHVVVQ